MGRKKKTLPTKGLETITELAERGVTETDIAKALGMSFDTWLRIKAENEEAKRALEEARAVEKDKLVGKAFEKAMDGDNTCLLFLLKTRHGFKEGAPVNANQVNVKISVPGSMNPQQYKKAIEVKEDE